MKYKNEMNDTLKLLHKRFKNTPELFEASDDSDNGFTISFKEGDNKRVTVLFWDGPGANTHYQIRTSLWRKNVGSVDLQSPVNWLFFNSVYRRAKSLKNKIQKHKTKTISKQSKSYDDHKIKEFNSVKLEIFDEIIEDSFDL